MNTKSSISRSRGHGVLLVVALVVCWSLALPTAAYEFEGFEVPGAPVTGGRGLNDGDCVVGYTQSDPDDFLTARAILRCFGVAQFLSIPTSIGDRRAFDLNAAGVIVGSALRASGSDGFELDDGVVTWVEFPGADQTVLRGINDLGDVVGEYEGTDGIRHGFVREGGVFQTIDVPLAVETRARGINNEGEIVGFWTDGAGLRHAFVREPSGIFTTFDFPGATETLLGDINDIGEMVGTYFDGDGTPHGFVVTAPLVEFVPFDVPGSVGTFATGINEAGHLTGEWSTALGSRFGFVATDFFFADGFESGDLIRWSSFQP